MPPLTSSSPVAATPSAGTAPRVRRRLGRVEFTSLLALSMALTALGIDIMLPAFADIRTSLGLPANSTAVAGLVTAYFLGLAVGQLAYGPLADRYGRRRALYVGYGIYLVAAVGAALAPSLGLLLALRFVWGVGAAGPRVATLAIIRDSYEGEQMSRAMSFVMAVFILVPVIAPSIGAALTAVVSWRFAFVACALAAAGLALWARRLPETLAPEDRLELTPGRILEATRFVLRDRQTVGYTVALAALYGTFTSWIASSEIILGEVFGQAATFPLWFGGLAAVMGVAVLLNARIVGRIGTRRLAHGVLVGYLGTGVLLVGVSAATGGRPPLLLFAALIAAVLAGHALLIPNFNTIAMQPMASVAGTASSVLGATTVAAGALLGSLLDRAFDGTVGPLALGLLVYGLLACAAVLWAERGRLFQPLLALPPAEPQLEPEVV